MILVCLFTVNSKAENTDTPSFKIYKAKKDSSISRPFTLMQSFKRNCTPNGLVFIADGLIITAQKKDFHSIKTFFQPHFEKTYDSYTQYAPLAAAFALKALGVKNTSTWKRMTLNSTLSYVTMATLVNSIKYSSKEMRPDHTTANSFPSGHTATAFAAATIFNKEYGSISPWYSVAGYSVATLTGITRIMNNRHWINDVLVGAGIGIVSADLGYMLGDWILKGKGIQNQPKNEIPDISENGSFFSMTVGSGIGPTHLNSPNVFDSYNVDMTPSGNPLRLLLKTCRSSSVNIESAYFINKYIGFGGRLKASTLPVIVGNFNHKFAYTVPLISTSYIPSDAYKLEGLESSHLGMIDMSLGFYGSIPVGTRLRLGTKFLFGNRLTTNYSVDAIFSFNTLKDRQKNYGEVLDNILQANGGSLCNISKDKYNPQLYHDNDFLQIKANNSFSFGTGLYITYAIKNQTAFMISFDYDCANPKYTFVLHNRYNESGGNVSLIEDSFQRRTLMNNMSLNLGMSVCL